ncbi:MAG: cofactor-independent phosphoglycerate mutase [Candidatus Bipolaricaulota bacterium]|nr:cofactor-independent phosphoglycerate mutase [Candidatus Bipolaricaulota bacterium]MCS7274946.1 cofactor-independent phosphoglycerate mutase [Candidatus Bipolaricaulota bacterium]MDW8110562.1 cofactor-independent phosphoglycerate mutase [Candidatus Bipolaricaulota bacterium]MDW8329955.1 cofactor-independent phosphoglycerate mutase [Candidatus Bipolaricaulota bacterium]
MKYAIVVGDGMGDYAYDELNGQTLLEYARTPHLDRLAQRSTVGLVETIPAGLPPGSDVGNLTLMGYDPQRYYTGRAPLEAAAQGITLNQRDLAIRCNLVTLGDNFSVMRDYSAGHIPTEEARGLIAKLQQALGGNGLEFYPGVSYRHLLIWRDAPIAPERASLTPPHEIPDQPISQYLPQGEGSERFRALIERSWEVLRGAHPTANSIWLWGAGRSPQMPTLYERYRLTGSVISAVDLIKGLGVYAGLRVINVPGATGYLDTNYAGKVQHALDSLSEGDLVYLHIEAPDECGHQGRLDLKLRAIEDFDSKVIGPLVAGLQERFGDFALLVTTDHYTPVRERVHRAAPVPFLIFRSKAQSSNGARGFHERAAAATGLKITPGHRLLDKLLAGL